MKQWAKLQLTAAHICNLHLEQHLRFTSLPQSFPFSSFMCPWGSLKASNQLHRRN